MFSASFYKIFGRGSTGSGKSTMHARPQSSLEAQILRIRNAPSGAAQKNNQSEDQPLANPITGGEAPD